MKKIEENILDIERCLTDIECPENYEGNDPCAECRTNQLLNLTYNGFTLRQALETILTIKEGECLAKVDAFNGEATLMVYPSPAKDNREENNESLR